MIKKQQMLRLKESRPRPFFDALHIEGEKRVFFIFHNRTLGAFMKCFEFLKRDTKLFYDLLISIALVPSS